MPSHTIRLDALTYRLNDDGVVEKLVYSSSDPEHWDNMEWIETPYRLGAQFVLYSVTDVSPNACRRGTKSVYHLHDDLDGIGGNSDHTIKRTEGWRGTTNDKSVDACGIVTIRKIRELRNGDISVTVRA